jgi:hypothetical protein
MYLAFPSTQAIGAFRMSRRCRGEVRMVFESLRDLRVGVSSSSELAFPIWRPFWSSTNWKDTNIIILSRSLESGTTCELGCSRYLASLPPSPLFVIAVVTACELFLPHDQSVIRIPLELSQCWCDNILRWPRLIPS